jgi:hypothetical protein
MAVATVEEEEENIEDGRQEDDATGLVVVACSLFFLFRNGSHVRTEVL